MPLDQQVSAAIIAVHGDPKVISLFPDLKTGMVVKSRKEPSPRPACSARTTYLAEG